MRLWPGKDPLQRACLLMPGVLWLGLLLHRSDFPVIWGRYSLRYVMVLAAWGLFSASCLWVAAAPDRVERLRSQPFSSLTALWLLLTITAASLFDLFLDLVSSPQVAVAVLLPFSTALASILSASQVTVALRR